MLTDKLSLFINDTENAQLNFELGFEYEQLGQTAAAVSFYLRSAERSLDDVLAYEALLRCSLCFKNQGNRDLTERGLLHRAVSVVSNRPEVYFLLSQYYERKKEWHESYLFANIGLNIADFGCAPLQTAFDYPGQYGLIFQKGISGWNLGLCDDSREIMFDLQVNHNLNSGFSEVVKNNLQHFGYPATVSSYKKNMMNKIKLKFNGLENIEKNYAQSYQDLFVLAALNGKQNGRYLEIGSHKPFLNNNTALFELNYNWTGVSIDIDREAVEEFMKERSNHVFCLDATKIDYDKFLDKLGYTGDFDYLQVDCEPPETTFEVLKRIPFDKYRFAIITFEHDSYKGSNVREESRVFLQSKGYELIVSDVGADKQHSYEDWWMHPALIDPLIKQQLQDISEGVKDIKAYLFPDKTIIKKVDSFVPAVVNKDSKVNNDYRNGLWVVDNFYKDPDAIRKFALEQEYHQGGLGRGYIGRRTFEQFLFPELKEEFERIMGRKITKWEEHGMNGRFQYSMEGEPLVYHCDSQQWAAMIYLTPDAPYETGTGTFACRGTKIHHNSHPDIMYAFRNCSDGGQNLDKTLFEPVDQIGNVYNRLVIFNAGYLHAALGYFGYKPENSRLWQMFFFD